MKLKELSPVQLLFSSGNKALAFLCPDCLECWLTVKFFAPISVHDQIVTIANLNLWDKQGFPVVPCKPSEAWRYTGTCMDDISITPSLNANDAGHWHGHVTNGEIINAGNGKCKRGIE